jgi:hypothetical protein
MATRKAPIRIYIAVSIPIILVVALFFANLAIGRLNPGGLDFLAHWQGARSFIIDGANPYSDQVARLIATKASEISPGETGDYRFVEPLLSLLVFTPFALIPEFEIARAMWMTLLEMSLLLSAYLIASLIRNKAWLIGLIVSIVVIGLNFPNVNSLLDGNLLLISIVLIVGSFYLLLRQNDEGAGLLLALSLVKPETAYPIIVVLLIWVILKKRWTVLWWFIAVVVILVGFSLVLIPNWPIHYLQSVIEFSARNPVRQEELSPTALEIRLLVVKNLAVGLLIIYEWFLVKTEGRQRLLWNMGLLMAVLPWIGRRVYLENTGFIFIALLIGLGFLSQTRINKSNLAFHVFSLLFVFSSWIFSGSLVPGISESWVRICHNAVLPVLALIILYWSRWWIIQREKFAVDTFKLTK